MTQISAVPPNGVSLSSDKEEKVNWYMNISRSMPTVGIGPRLCKFLEAQKTNIIFCQALLCATKTVCMGGTHHEI